MSYEEKAKALVSGAGGKIPLFKVNLSVDCLNDLKPVIESGFIGQGPKVDEFESKLENLLGGKVLTTVNGTAAIRLALRLCSVDSNSEVITTPMTCLATNTPIMEMGAKIVWADVDPVTGNIDPDDVRKKITPKTDAIICVHWGGFPCKLSEFEEIEQLSTVPVIQDAAHAIGAYYGSRKISSWTSFSCYSFQAIKHLTTVDGGALVCKGDSDYRKGKLLRWYGLDRTSKETSLRCRQNVKECGYKYHMNDVCATIGLRGLTTLKSTLHAHRENALRFSTAFSILKHIRKLPYFEFSAHTGFAPTGSFWFYTILVDEPEKFVEFMDARGIVTSPVHIRNDKYDAFAKFACKKGELPGVDEFCSRQVSIPCGWWLSEKDMKHIINSVKEFDSNEC